MRSIIIPLLGPKDDQIAARVLDQNGAVVAVIAEPIDPPDIEPFRDAVVDVVFAEDFGDIILAGVSFADRWGGDAVGFT